jgi:hypothetical protein
VVLATFLPQISDATGTTATPSIEERIAAVRERMRQESSPETASSEMERRSSITAQWPNYWGNWPNWPNYWGNWPNYWRNW